MDSVNETSEITWRPVRDRVYVTTIEPESVNCGLVVGSDACLLIDTGSSASQGAALRRSIAEITGVPLRVVVVTHHHGDHVGGLEGFADVETIGHETLEAPLTTRFVAIGARDLGDLHVEIGHFGAAHTQGDLVVLVPTARVLFAGDLVEHGAPPQVDETTSLKNWPVALEALLTLCRDDTVVVPGHGELVDSHYVAWQRAGLAAIYGQCEWLVTQGVAESDAFGHPELQWPWDDAWVTAAIHQGYAELAAEGKVPRRTVHLPLQSLPGRDPS